MEFKGEIFAIATSLLWTCTALCFEYSSKKAGALPINIIRLAMAFIMLLVLLFFTTGSPFPLFADKTTWMWLAISGLIGFVMGDFFLFNSYTLIGSRSTQLFMTLGTPFAVIAGVFILNQQLSLLSMAGICVTLSGIFISILGRENNNEGEKSTIKLKLPVKGVIFGVMAALGQGIGLVFSKLGLNSYTESMAVNNASENTVMMMPFAASMIRTIAGLVGFFIIMLATNRLGSIGQAIKQRKTMAVASMGTFFGPFVGVSFSLIAVQYAPVGIASILTSLSPIFILLPYHFIYKQKITNIEVIGAFISIIGIGILFI